MNGRLTTHVLDTAAGRPAAGMRVTLSRLVDGDRQPLAHLVTNADGRCDRPLLEGAAMLAGPHELLFAVGAYFRAAGTLALFLDEVPVRFTIDDAQAHYHVPLLVSPFAYSTYRGS